MTDLDSDGQQEMYPQSGVTPSSDRNAPDGSNFPGAAGPASDGVDQDCDGADTDGGGGGGATVTVYGDGTRTLFVENLDSMLDGTPSSWSLTLTCY